MPSEYDAAPLRWVASQIAQDPRFARATVKNLFSLLTSVDLVEMPTNVYDPDYELQVRAFLAQETENERVRAIFTGSTATMNLKIALAEIIKGPWFRATNAETSDEVQPLLLATQVGTGKLLTPEQLNRKIRSLTGFLWRTATYRAELTRRLKEPENDHSRYC